METLLQVADKTQQEQLHKWEVFLVNLKIKLQLLSKTTLLFLVNKVAHLQMDHLEEVCLGIPAVHQMPKVLHSHPRNQVQELVDYLVKTILNKHQILHLVSVKMLLHNSKLHQQEQVYLEEQDSKTHKVNNKIKAYLVLNPAHLEKELVQLLSPL